MNPVTADWLHTFATELNGNFLMNTAKGKTAYACGIAYALTRLKPHCEQSAWEQLQADATEFCDDYMRGG